MIHQRAVVHETVAIPLNTEVGPCAVIEAGASIGSGVRVEALAYVGPGIVVGHGAQIGVRATVLADVPEGTTVRVTEVWTGVSERLATKSRK